MNEIPDDRLERKITEALALQRNVRAPEGFTDRVGARLYYAQLLTLHRRRTRQAWAAALGGAAAITLIAALFIEAVNVPAWVLENVPGVLGRFDAAYVLLTRATVPLALTVAGGAAAAVAWGTLRLRTRRAQSSR